MPELEVKETTGGAIRRSTYRAYGLSRGDTRSRGDGYAAEIGVDGEVVPVAQDDGRPVARDHKDPADDARENGIGTAIAIEPEVHATAIDLDTTMLAMLMHAKGAEDRVRAMDRRRESPLILSEGRSKSPFVSIHRIAARGSGTTFFGFVFSGW